jgi:hypothetical protein
VPEAVGSVVEWCRVGPAGARVDGVEVRPAQPELAAAGFRIVP